MFATWAAIAVPNDPPPSTTTCGAKQFHGADQVTPQSELGNKISDYIFETSILKHTHTPQQQQQCLGCSGSENVLKFVILQGLNE